jgi:predicted GIY-YIG superfamily endonuclease
MRRRAYSLLYGGKNVFYLHYIPWKLEFYAAFPNKSMAMNFEKYLKSGSGKAFSKRHF